MENRQFDTGMCEETHSKRVIVDALRGVKGFLGHPVYTVKRGVVERQMFDGAITVDGCLRLTGAVVRGVSLFDAFRFPVPAFSSETFDGFRALFLSFLESASVLKARTGSLPRLFLNGVFVDSANGAFSYLPQELSEFLSAYVSEREKKTIMYVVGRREDTGPPCGPAAACTDERSDREIAFAESCARLVYCYFAGGGGAPSSAVYFLADRVPGFPLHLADLVWDSMHGKAVGLEPLRRACVPAPVGSADVPADGAFAKVPFRRRKGYLDLKHALGTFLTSKWKLILFLLLVGGVLAYLLADLAGSKSPADYASGLDPRGVVELYYGAMNRLDLDAIQSLFSRRAGRKVMNDLSALYVMSKLGQVYGGRYGTVDGSGSSSILSIEDLRIEEVSDGEKPAFHARYKKTINTGEKKTEVLIDETVTLGRVKDRWSILSVESRIAE
jgi:hypothetical protein